MNVICPAVQEAWCRFVVQAALLVWRLLRQAVSVLVILAGWVVV